MPYTLCSCFRLEQELEELETGVSATSTKENLADADQQEETKTVENIVVSFASLQCTKKHTWEQSQNAQKDLVVSEP